MRLDRDAAKATLVPRNDHGLGAGSVSTRDSVWSGRFLTEAVDHHRFRETRPPSRLTASIRSPPM